MTTFQAFSFITTVVILIFSCIVCPPAGAIAIIFWFTAGTACKNAEERRLAKMRSTRQAEFPRPGG
jgi:hypothetical protein